MRFVARGFITLLALAALTARGGEVAAQQPAAGRIGFVNARLVLTGMPGYAQAESTFSAEAQVGQDQARRLQATFDSAVAAFQQQEPMLTPSIRDARRKELQQQGQQMQQKAQEIQVRLAQRERELLEPMQTRLTAVIEGIRAEGNYAMIIDLSAEGHAIVTYDKSLDITDRVVQRLRQSN